MAKIRAKVNGKEVDLESYLMECIRIAVDIAANKAVDFLAQYIIDNWYDAYTPKKYKRTYDFLNSASKTETTVSGRKGNSVVCMIYFDRDKIIPKYYGPKELNPHAGRDGSSIADSIPRMIEQGFWFYGRGKTEGLGSMEATIDMLERDFHKMVEKELRKMGLPLTVSRK